MAKGYVESLLNALDAPIKRVLVPALNYLQDNWRLGDGPRAANAQWYQFSSTTNSTANDEFSIFHNLGSPPRWLIPVLDLSTFGLSALDLRTSTARLADDKRVYLTSPTSNAQFTCFLEV